MNASTNRTARWIAVTCWVAAIFATVPIAESIQGAVAERFGRDAFFVLAISIAVAVTAVLLVRGRRSFAMTASRAGVLITIAVLFVAATLRLSTVPEEAIHFVEYGVLGVLVYRALAPDCENLLVYPTALMVCASVAQLDEALQWAMPGRYWELRDVGINITAVSLVLAAIAFGIAPARVSGDGDARSARRLLRASAVAALLLALSMLNTPDRIARYTSAIDSLAFLANADSAMFEYGYYYADAETGRFKSRLPPAELAAADLLRGAEVGAILDRYATPQEYADVLRIYSPVTDPFVHEVRVHLFRRDRYYERALGYAAGSKDRLRCATIAYSEHKILQKYFGNTLKHSQFVLDQVRLQLLETQLLSEPQRARAIADSESAVSRSLVTAVTEAQLMAMFATFFVAALFVDRRLSASLAR